MIRIIYRIEASPSLRLVNMDVTNEDHVRHALDYVAENLPAGQHGKNQSTMHHCRHHHYYIYHFCWPPALDITCKL